MPHYGKFNSFLFLLSHLTTTIHRSCILFFRFPFWGVKIWHIKCKCQCYKINVNYLRFSCWRLPSSRVVNILLVYSQLFVAFFLCSSSSLSFFLFFFFLSHFCTLSLGIFFAHCFFYFTNSQVNLINWKFLLNAIFSLWTFALFCKKFNNFLVLFSQKTWENTPGRNHANQSIVTNRLNVVE